MIEVSWQSIITAGAVVSAILAIVGAVLAVIKWAQKPDKVEAKVDKLQQQHEEDIKLMKEELCVLSYGMLAALDGLIQKGCNGNVTKAYDALEKHLNKQAHDIHSERSG